MRKLKLYLETSVWSHYYANDAEEQMKDTRLLFAEVDEQKYNIFISRSVITEIDQTKGERRLELQMLLDRYQPILLEAFGDTL